RPGVPRRRLWLDARGHGRRSGALAWSAPDLSTHRKRERLLRGEVRVPGRRSLDPVQAGREQRNVRCAVGCGSRRDAPRPVSGDDELFEIARTAARAAASLLAGAAASDIRAKGNPRDLVTEWDLRSEEMIRRVLEERAPGIPILAEEGGQTGPTGDRPPGAR